MEYRPHPAQTGSPDSGPVRLGTGWVMPTALIASVIALVYLPVHGDAAPGVQSLAALVATLYVAGLVIAAPRLARSAVLRAGGRPFRVVLLGSGADEVSSPDVRVRWRIASIAVGASVSLAILATAYEFASRVAVGAYPHAVASVGADLAFMTALAAFFPAPPFVGWSLLLALLDGLGTPRPERIRRAARLSRILTTPLVVAGAALTTIMDPWLAIPLGALAIAHVWHNTDVEVGRDSLSRFLSSHTVGDLARPPLARVGPDDEVLTDLPGAHGRHGAVFVEDRRLLVGAIGTHRLNRAGGDGGRRSGRTWRTTATPVAVLSWLHPTEPASRTLPALQPSGVVLVIMDGEIRAIEEDDLFDQVSAWVRQAGMPDSRAQRA